MSTEIYNIVTVIIYGVTALCGLGMLFVAVGQLKKINTQVEEASKANIEASKANIEASKANIEASKSNKISELQAFLELERHIADSRRELAKASMEVQIYSDKEEDVPSSVELYFSECLENHLNVLDRLCFCILKEYFNNDDMKIEYRHVINKAVDENVELFNTSTKHRNIKKIYDKWADS